MTNEEYKKLEKEFYQRRLEGPILDVWRDSLACPLDGRSVVLENDKHVVLKHASHSAWYNKGLVYAKETCGVFAELYDKNLHKSGQGIFMVLTGLGGVKRWPGRVNLKKIIADCAGMGIIFQKSNKP